MIAHFGVVPKVFGVFLRHLVEGDLVSDEVRKLAYVLAQSFQSGVGAHLTPPFVDVALAALRAHADMTGSGKIKVTSRMLQVEAMDSRGWAVEVLAVSDNAHIGRAAFDEAIRQRPGCAIRLRQGARVIAPSE